MLFFGRVYKCSVENTHTHTHREREERVVVCAQKRSSFPRPKNRSLLSFFFVPQRKKKERKERRKRDEGFFRFKTPLCSFVCANTTTKAPRGEKSVGVVKGTAAIVGEEKEKEKKREKEATLEEKEDTTMGKKGKKKKGEGVFGNTNVSKKKKRDISLFKTHF